MSCSEARQLPCREEFNPSGRGNPAGRLDSPVDLGRALCNYLERK